MKSYLNFKIIKLFCSIPFSLFFKIFNNSLGRRILQIQDRSPLPDDVQGVIENLGIGSTLDEIDQVNGIIQLRDYYDTYKYHAINKNNVDKHIHFKGLHNLKNALKSNHSVLLFTFHYDRFLLPLVCLGALGFEIGLLTADPQSFPKDKRQFQIYKINQIKKKMRGPFFTTKSYFKKIYSYLKNEKPKILTIIIDNFQRKKFKGAQEVDFLGSQRFVHDGISRISKYTESICIPYYTFHEDGVQYCSIGPQFRNNNIEDMLNYFERVIKDKPEPWWNWHNMI